MKKIINYLIVIMCCIFTFINVNAAASEFSSLLDFEYDFDTKEIYVILGFDGEPAYKVKQTVIYDNKYIELKDAICQEDFEMVDKSSQMDGNDIVSNYTCESPSIYDDTKYLLLVFKMKDNYKVGKSAYITVKDIVAYGEEFKYRDTGKYIIVKRDKPLELTIIPKDYNDSIKFRLWMEDNIVFICFGFIVLFLFIIFIFMPTISRTESKDNKMRRQIKRNHKIAKSVKKLELEKEPPRKEEQKYEGFDPFKDNVSKTSDDTLDNHDDLQNLVDAFEMKKRVKADFSSAIEEFTEITDETNAKKGDTNKIINQQVEKASNVTEEDKKVFNNPSKPKVINDVEDEMPMLKTKSKPANNNEDLVLFNPINLEDSNKDK